MPADLHPPTEEPDLTWDPELSKWVPAYRQTRWDHTAAEAATGAELQVGAKVRIDAHHPTMPAAGAVKRNHGRTGTVVPSYGSGYDDDRPRLVDLDGDDRGSVLVNTAYLRELAPGPVLDPLERRIGAAILSAYLVPLDVLPAMVERVADAVRPAAPAEREQPTWLLDLVHAAETAADETACNGDHETHDGCDGCATQDGPVLGEDAEWREDIAHVLRPHVGSWAVARAVADEMWQTVIASLVVVSEQRGAEAERERREKEQDRRARAALGLSPKPLDGPQ